MKSLLTSPISTCPSSIIIVPTHPGSSSISTNSTGAKGGGLAAGGDPALAQRRGPDARLYERDALVQRSKVEK